MSVVPDLELLTMREVAELLKVSEVTVARWLKQGRLPAYRVGPRAVRVRREDVEQMMEPVEAPIASVAPSREREDIDDWKAAAFRPLTDEERERGLQWLQKAIELGEAISARRGGKPFSVPSEEIIRGEREKRTRQIDQAIWGGRPRRKTAASIDSSSSSIEQE